MTQTTTHPVQTTGGFGLVVSREILAGIVAFAIAVLALGYGLGRIPLVQPDEGRNAEVAREMKESGRWLVPTYNGADYLDKPAFYFRAVALSLAVLGDNEIAARAPSALFGLGLLVATYFFCRRTVDSRCAALAVMVIATTPLYVVYSRLVIFDVAVTFFACIAIYAGYLAEENEGAARRNWYLLGAAAAGFGTLVKGPVGFIVPALVLAVFNFSEGRRGALKRLLAPLNLAVFFAVVLPWFIGVTLAHPDFPRYGIIEESFHRFTTSSFRRTKPFYFFPLIIAGTFFPWSLLLPESIVVSWRRRAQWSRLDRFCLIWSIVVVIFFSLSKSKMPGYILSVVVSLGVLIARVFDRGWDVAGEKAGQLVLRAAVGLVVVTVGGAAFAGYVELRPLEFGRMIRLSPEEARQLTGYVGPFLASLLLVAAIAGLARYRRSVPLTFAAFVLFTVTLLVGNGAMGGFFLNRRSARDLAIRLSPLPSTTEVMCLKCLPHGLPFYLKRTVTLVTVDGSELTSNYVLFDLKTNPQWPSNLVPWADRDQWLDAQRRPVYLVAKTGSKSTLNQISEKRGGTVVQLTDDYCGLLLPAPGGS